jgi:hypothetical protein
MDIEPIRITVGGCDETKSGFRGVAASCRCAGIAGEAAPAFKIGWKPMKINSIQVFHGRLRSIRLLEPINYNRGVTKL